MKNTNYRIARIMISVESTYELKDSGGYALYRLGEQSDLDVPEDNLYKIQLVEDSEFPAMEGHVLFQNEMNLYFENDGEILHFFRIPLTNRVAAWCETTGEKSLTIHFKPTARLYFGDAVGCFNAAAFEYVLYVFRRFLLHCSYVDVGGEAALFLAHSGGGKTTHGLLWEKCGLGEMINGDRAAIEMTDISKCGDGKMTVGMPIGRSRNTNRKFMVHGLPIAGSSNVFKNRSLPLRALFLLEKAPVNEVIEIPASRQFIQVFEQVTIHTWDREFIETSVDFVTKLVECVPVRLLRCRPDEGAVHVVKKALDFK